METDTNTFKLPWEDRVVQALRNNARQEREYREQHERRQKRMLLNNFRKLFLVFRFGKFSQEKMTLE